MEKGYCLLFQVCSFKCVIRFFAISRTELNNFLNILELDVQIYRHLLLKFIFKLIFFWPGNFRLYGEKKALMSADDEFHILDVEIKKIMET